jgi:hypothetical protein
MAILKEAKKFLKNLPRILSTSRYQTTHIAESNSFVFVTDTGLKYTIYFDFNSKIFPNENLDEYAIYMGFSREPLQVPFGRKHDPRVGETIMYLVANIFNQHKRALILYVCSPADQQARQRSIAFRKWYAESHLTEKIEHMPRKIGGTYTGALYSKKHPLIDEINFALQTFDPADKFDLFEEDAATYLTIDEDDFDDM